MLYEVNLIDVPQKPKMKQAIPKLAHYATPKLLPCDVIYTLSIPY
jgi:hypothetical protein